MKKTLLLGLLMAAGLSANAQLANGSDAPDFTATDINGETFNLYDLLAEGKTVIVDVSATWCGPCWNFHNSHALDKLNKTYGDYGSEEVVVLFVEGDPNTTLGNLMGENDTDYAPTQGNWVEGSSYHFIHEGGAEIGNLLAVESFPTVYRICPDKKVFYFDPTINGMLTFNSILDNVNDNCGEITAPQNHGEVMAEDARLCQATDATDVEATIQNFGGNNITTATVNLKNGDATVATATFDGNLAPYANAASVTFEGVEFVEGGVYTVELADVNGGAAANAELAEAGLDYSVATTGENNLIEVVIYTDLYAHEASWEIRDAEGTLVAEGGDYQEGDEDEFGAGGPDANTDIHHWVTLPEGDAQCYTVILKDAFGDGWIYTGEGGDPNENHGVEIYSSGELVYQQWVGNFGEEFEGGSAFRTMGVLGNEEVEATAFSVFPNPTTGVLNFVTNETVEVTVTDLTGKVVFNAKGINNGDAVNLGSLQSGMYIAKINGASSERTEKIVIK